MIEKWKAEGIDAVETTRRLIDLFFVSVLLDAGAGDAWKFKEPGTSNSYGRSEGIAVASLYMAEAGVFNTNAEPSVAVDGKIMSTLSHSFHGNKLTFNLTSCWSSWPHRRYVS